MSAARCVSAVVIAFTSLGACRSSDDLPRQNDEPHSLTHVVITPARAKLHKGQLLALRAIGTTAKGDRVVVTASWASATPEIVTVSSDGLVTALRPGVSDITAAAGPLSATSSVEVAAPREGEPAAILVGAGDIGDCSTDGPASTARILDTVPGIVFTAGDNAYPRGSRSDFAECYDQTWGRHKHRTRPSPGNHDYRTEGAGPYFAYFGANAGDPDRGYYSYEAGPWHIVALNSEARMEPGSPQEQWLRADLTASRARCTLAYMHRPRFSSGDSHGSQRRTAPLFEALYEHGADLLIGGHDHVYERFAPQSPDGRLDRSRGVRQLVVGTGGRKRDGFRAALPNSEVRYNATKGVIRLTLFADRYDWEFIPASGDFRDRGSDVCH